MDTQLLTTRRTPLAVNLSDLPHDTVAYEICPLLDLPSLTSLTSSSKELYSLKSKALSYSNRKTLDFYDMLDECSRLNYHHMVEFLVLARFRTLVPRRSYPGVQLALSNVLYGAAKGGNIQLKIWALKRIEEKCLEGYYNAVELTLAAEHGQITYLENAFEVFMRHSRYVDKNDFPKSEIAIGAFQGGQVSVLEFLERNELTVDWTESTRLARAALEAKKLDCIKYSLGKGQFHLADSLLNQTAAEIGSLEIIQFLVDNGCEIEPTFLRHAVSHGHLHILQWYEKGNFNPVDYNMVAKHAIVTQDMRWMEWLKERNYRFETEHFIATLRNEPKFRWLMAGGYSFDLHRIRVAVTDILCRHPFHDLFNLWSSFDAEFQSVACDVVVSQSRKDPGLVDDLKKLHERYGCAITPKLMEATACVSTNQYRPFVEFCMDLGVKLTEGCLIKAAKANSWSSFEYLLAKNCPRTPKLLGALVEGGNLDKVKHYYEKGLPIGKEVWESMTTYTFDYFKNWEGYGKAHGKFHPSLIHNYLQSIDCPTE